MSAGGRSRRAVLAIAAGITALLATFPYGCDDGAGSGWERCQSVLGFPIGEPITNGDTTTLSSIIPPVVALLVALLVWWLLGRTERTARTVAIVTLVLIVGAWIPFVIGLFTT
jgi:hypothetical protein